MSGISTLPQHLQQRLRDELKAGETIAWAGQPDPNGYMRTGFTLWYFFIPWTALSLFMMAALSGFKWPRFDQEWNLGLLFVLPFLLIGLAGLYAPFWARRKAVSTIYAITNQRALVIDGARSIKVKTYLPVDIGILEKTVYKDGSGDLILRTENYDDSDGNQRTLTEGFFAIDDVRHVEHLIERLAKAGPAISARVF